MHNELIKTKIRDKNKLLKLCKLNYIHKTNSIPSKTKTKNKINHNEILSINFLRKKLYKKYNTLPEKYALIQIENFIKAKYCHTLSYFKEDLIFNYCKEFMKKFYKKNESIKKIPLFVEFYKTYLQFFCAPTLTEINLNELIEERVELKAMAFYKDNYKEKKDDNKKEKKKYINTLFFTSQVRKDISRKNTLNNLSKTTIEFNNKSEKYLSSNKSINILINEMEKKRNDINIMNNNEYNINLLKNEKKENLTDRNFRTTNLIKKNIFTGSFNSITSKEGKSSFIKKIPKINFNFNNNKISKTNTENTPRNRNIKYIKINTSNISKLINSIDYSNRRKYNINTMNNTKPIYHRINIVNNKIIIINNDSKGKKTLMKQMTSKNIKNKKPQKKNNLTLLSRNYHNDNNNYFGSFYGNAYDMFKSQEKKIKSKKFNTTSSIKTYNQERKTSFKVHNNNLKKINNKSSSKISHIKKLKEKNLILKTQKSKNIHMDNNNILNTNLFSSHLTGSKTERNISKEKTKQRLTNFQMFNNNIKSINRIKHIKDISNDKYSSKNIKSTNSLINTTNKIKKVLKLSTLNTVEKNKNVHNKSKIVLITSKTKVRKSNSKVKSNKSNKKENIFNNIIKK